MVRYANPIRPEFSRRESIEESGFALTMRALDIIFFLL